MQKLPVYLYPNSFEVILDLDNNSRINNVMYQRDITLQKGVKNNIQFQVKNSDQKPLNVSSSTFVFSMFDATNQRLIIEKPLTILDDGVTLSLKGLTQLSLLEGDLWGLDTGSYQFGIKLLDPTDGTYTPAYSNTYYGMAGIAKVAHDFMPALAPTQTVTTLQKFLNRDYNAGNFYWVTGGLRAYPEYHSNGEYHTMAVYMTNYTGTLYSQATLDNNPPPPGFASTYATLEQRHYNSFTGIDYFNFQGAFTYVQLEHIPDNPVGYPGLNDQTQYTGTVDKVLYRG
jgi:hypothetical protein